MWAFSDWADLIGSSESEANGKIGVEVYRDVLSKSGEEHLYGGLETEEAFPGD